MRKEFFFVGIDPYGIKRAWAIHHNVDVAETWCVAAINDYVRSNPHLGPVSKWTLVYTDQIDDDWQEFTPIARKGHDNGR